MFKIARCIKVLFLLLITSGVLTISGQVSHLQAQSSQSSSSGQTSSLTSLDSYNTPDNTSSDKNLLNFNSGVGNGVLPGLVYGLEYTVSQYVYSYVATEVAPKGKTALDEYFKKNNGGLVSLVGNVNAMLLQQRPASGVDYLQDKVYALSHPGEIYAQSVIPDANPARYYQGTGYDLLRPVQGFWGWSFKIVTGILILLVIAIAFAIMFRQKLGGSAVVTIQNAIPNIAIALVLIPFSYAITGLAIDAITLGTNVAHDAIIGPGSPGEGTFTNRNTDIQGAVNIGENKTDRGLYPDDFRINVFNVRNRIDISQQVKEAGDSILGTTTAVDNRTIFDIIANILNGLTNTDKDKGTLPYWIGSILNFILSILMIYIGIKIFAKLFMKYVMIILMPIFSPFVFATIAVPGNGTKTILLYVKTLFSASAAYVATYALFLLTLVLTSTSFQNTIPNAKTGTFVPPLLGIGDLLGNQGNSGFVHLLFSLIGIGIYFSIPAILKQIDTALGVDPKLLMKFVQTPLDSIRDSANVTFKGVPAFGASVARTTLQGAGRTRDLYNNRFGLPALNTRLRNLQDTNRGIKPGEEGSYQRTVANQYAKEQKESERKRAEYMQNRANALERLKANPNDIVAQNDLRTSEAGIRQENSRQADIARRSKASGIQPGYGKDEKEPEIAASVDYDGGGRVILTKVEYEKLKNAGYTGKLEIGKLKIKLDAVGFKFPQNVKLEVFNPKKRTDTSGLEPGPMLINNVTAYPSSGEPLVKSNSLVKPGNPEFNFSPGRPFPLSNDQIKGMEIRVKGSYDTKPKDSSATKFEVPLDIFITSAADFYDKILSETKFTETETIMFKVGSYESNPISIIIQVKE